ncbi:MAG: site-specific DNA-methyltransferase [Candidatus Omnitrophota bacterium]
MELNKIYNNDFRDKSKEINDNVFNCIIIDPPYSGAVNKTTSGTRMRQEEGNHIDYDDMTERTFLKFMGPILKELYRVSKIGGHFYCFSDWKQLRNMMDLIELSSFKIINLICWDKEHFGLGSGYRPQHEFIIVASKGLPNSFNLQNLANVIRCKKVYKKTHPHEKPQELIEKLILNSTNKGDLVLDSFCGTGVVPLICKKHDRNFMGYELSATYCHIANRRIAEAQNTLFRAEGV